MKKSFKMKINRAMAMILAIVIMVGLIPTSVLVNAEEYGPSDENTNVESSEEDLSEEEPEEESEDDAEEEPEEESDDNPEEESEDDSEEDPETAQITVGVSDKATVKLNDVEQNSITVKVGDEVKVEIIPEESCYIKSVTVGDYFESVEKGMAFCKSVIVTADMNITAEIVEEVEITSSYNGCGTVKLNDNEENSLTVDKGSTVAVSVQAEEGYVISYILIGVESQEISDTEIFTKEIVVNEDTNISVSFVKLYKVTVEYNDKGVVVTNPDASGGFVDVIEGETVTINATPNKKCRVSEVLINDVKDESVLGNNDESYSKSFDADGNYSFVITFAPNRYFITVNEPEHGQVSIDKTEVDYNGDVTLYLKPDDGYSVEITVKDAGSTKDGTPYEPSGYSDSMWKVVIPGIKEDKEIFVEFKLVSSYSLDKVSFNEDDAVRINDDRTLFVFKKGTTVTLTSTETAIGVNKDINLLQRYSFPDLTKNRKYESEVITKDTLVEEIYLFHYGFNDSGWNPVDFTPFQIAFDETAPNAEISTTEEPNANGYYGQDISVNIKVNDEGYYSGIKSVKYSVIVDGESEGVFSLYSKGIFNDVGGFFEENIKISAQGCNSDNVKLEVYVEDLAGNTATYTKNFKINVTVPTVSVSMEPNEIHKEATAGYYNQTRTAYVTFVDRASCFDQDVAQNCIKIEAKDALGNVVQNAAKISWSNNGDTHVAKIEFSTDANYEWHIDTYNNKADLENNGILSEAGDDIYRFTVDTKAPTGTLKTESNSWDKFLNIITIGFYTNYPVTVEGTIEDTTSPVYDIQYFKSNSDETLSEEELESLFNEGKFSKETITVNKDQKFVVYARLADYAGNHAYINTDGIIYDSTQPVIKLIPEEPNSNGYYNKDVSIVIDITDFSEDLLSYSGVKTVSYTVLCDNKITQSEVLYSLEKENPKFLDLTSGLNGGLVVDALKNNSDNVEVIVTVVDNAGNTSQSNCYLKINVDELTAKLSFNENEPKNIVDGRGYYNLKRRATLTITDRATSFDASQLEFSINAVDSNGTAVEDAYTIENWSDNGNEHSVDIYFSESANIDWSFSYTNKAGNELNLRNVDTYDAATPFKFTIDKEKPTGEVKIKTNVWDKLLSILTFGLYSNVKLDVTATAKDKISPFKIEYFKYNGDTALTAEDLDTKVFEEFTDFSVDKDEQFTVYLKITDLANNYTYISSDGAIVDMSASNIELSPDNANVNGCYNGDVDIAISIFDEEPYSGIKSIDFAVVKDGDSQHPTQSGNLYTFDVENPAKSDLLSKWDGEITVDSELNNSSDVVVTVTVIDNAGNESSQSVSLDIDITKPAIEITYDNNKDNNGNCYFNASRTATIVITERTCHFDAEAANGGISIVAKDIKGTDINEAYVLSSWTTVEGQTPDKATHTATIHFEKDANYAFAFAYTDRADNKNESIDTKTSVAPLTFTIDTVNPEGTLTAVSQEGREVTWNNLENYLTFGFWSKEKISIGFTAEDVTSPIASIEYYKATAKEANDLTSALSAEALDKLTEWSTFEGLEISEDEQFVVYVKISDEAGNYIYVSTDGLIVDKNSPSEELVAPEISVTVPDKGNVIYNSDVNIKIAVEDPLVGGTHSGLKTISYKVFNMGTETQSGTIFSFDVQNPNQSDLIIGWEGGITVDSALNNSNDVRIEIYAEDNSLNSSKNSISIKVDITAPTISISYDNNNSDNDQYFKENRTATITVKERNFRAEDVKVTITNTDAIIPSVSGWKEVGGSGNLDDTLWIANIVYSADGDYKFGISYTDLAANDCKDISYGNSVNPTEFTIDKTVPTINVSYDNDNAINSNYYKEGRFATIVINEHNFNADNVIISLTASDNGQTIGTPAVDGWTSNGDVHTAKINYSEDALYSFDIAYTDVAGNPAAEFEKHTFYVDKTAPALEITGVKDKSANNGDVIPVITYSDTNFDAEGVTITLTGANRKTVPLEGVRSDIENGQIFKFDNFKKDESIDDIYTLTAKLTDKAGNTSEQTVLFSVNRFGSTYALSKETEELNGTYVKSPIDVVIEETNVDALENIQLTLFKNNETIVLQQGEDADYTVEITGGNGEWYHYVYKIFAKNFTDDGVYRLTLHSEDNAGNVAENTLDTKNAVIQFGVDKSCPTITVTNLESEKTYALENMTVNMSIKDNLLLQSVSVYLDDSSEALKTWNADEIAEIIEKNGDFSFDIDGNSTKAHDLKIVTVDAAGNELVKEVTDFYVTTNIWVRFYTNKPLFFGSIGGIVFVGIAAVFIVVFKRKKDKQ